MSAIIDNDNYGKCTKNITISDLIGAEVTRQCLVCECKENPNAVVVDTSKAWLCDECRSAMLKVRLLMNNL